MPWIGEDIDNKTNLDNGYLRMFYYKTFLNKDKSLNEDSILKFKRSVPKHYREISDLLMLNEECTIKILLTEYNSLLKKGAINKEIVPKDEHSLLDIAVEIEYYWGLNTINIRYKKNQK